MDWVSAAEKLILVGGFNPTHLENMSQTSGRGENKKCLRCQHLATRYLRMSRWTRKIGIHGDIGSMGLI